VSYDSGVPVIAVTQTIADYFPNSKTANNALLEKTMAIKLICLLGIVMTLMTNDKNSDFETQAASFKDGFWYEFTDGDNEIAVHGSAWTGKETVYFNDEVVADKRNLTRLKEEHHFTKGDHEYRVQLFTTSILKMQVMCQVWKDGTLLGSKTKGLVTILDKKQALWKILLFIGAFFGAGLLVGMLSAALAASDLFLK
jgi:hypothetical protein